MFASGRAMMNNSRSTPPNIRAGHTLIMLQRNFLFPAVYSHDYLSMLASSDQPPSPVSNQANGTTGWELALVTAPSSNESANATSKLVQFLKNGL